MRAAAALLALAALGSPARAAPADEEAVQATIVAALTEDVVEIRSNFAGAELVLYGAAAGVEEDDEIAVVVRGPERDIRVMRKDRVLGIWINRAPIRFEAVDGYYAVASTAPLPSFATFSALRRNGIGLEHLRLSAPETERVETRFGVSDVVVSELGGEIVEYREAIVRARARDGLFREEPAGVEMLEGGLFRARVRLPPKTPVGSYAADVYLFRGGEPIASRRAILEVRKAGIERAVFNMAHESPLAYGLLAVIMAVVSGWSAAEAFRRR